MKGRDHATTMITATWHATSADELREIAGWVHDAYFAWEEVDFDREAAVVTVPFQQEPTHEAECGQAGARLVKRGRFGRHVYRAPFVRCTLTIRRAQTCAIDDLGRDEPGMLTVVEADGASGGVLIEAMTGPDVRVRADAIEVEIAMSDELAFHIRRAVWFGESDRPWRSSD